MRLRRAAAAYRRTTEADKRAHDALVAEVLAALDVGVQQVDIVSEIGFTREWVRRKVVDAKKAAPTNATAPGDSSA